jgi:hypothetical protein
MDRQDEAPIRISAAALLEVHLAFNEYRAAVQASDLSSISQNMYQYLAGNFVRWCNGEFKPGSGKAPYRIVNEKKAG